MPVMERFLAELPGIDISQSRALEVVFLPLSCIVCFKNGLVAELDKSIIIASQAHDVQIWWLDLTSIRPVPGTRTKGRQSIRGISRTGCQIFMISISDSENKCVSLSIIRHVPTRTSKTSLSMPPIPRASKPLIICMPRQHAKKISSPPSEMARAGTSLIPPQS